MRKTLGALPSVSSGPLNMGRPTLTIVTQARFVVLGRAWAGRNRRVVRELAIAETPVSVPSEASSTFESSAIIRLIRSIRGQKSR